MDLEIAEPAANAAIGRRNLIGMAGVAGLAGAAAAMLSAQTTLAASDQANQPTDADMALLAEALGLELTARDLYRSQVAANPSGDLASAVSIMAENHEAYAQAIAGATGLSASDDKRNAEVFDALAADFAGSDFAAAAHGLEQTAVATHTALLGEYESADAITLTTSILVTEARHATVLAAVLGVDDLDTLFGNDQPALALGGDA
ncbi:ferritin-like domain-containing protein [Ilumatobacter coccineus]|uniref:DUF4439 domain-containing protein n=1 Tax=Ilumatobacter coccineus (strain NBRC 103263 / KCTC 29153 / YM16-304) TaxID=1313172 RepID=A0A6C7EAR6_ILUCY|nr:ferritin-like domain-containing protein [Ilumatobacter coccineus]BAN02215.1 hypothetical protein YM304_19010 [Ilumatobacter coccineus YM16-304]